ncbi:CoA transferase [Pigmentiphaga soli]|uniref:CoA transferase n=1 Tax=Pigmentiphaga soli TaxID=1007095 RepID=A0ABP8H237_9BURK
MENQSEARPDAHQPLAGLVVVEFGHSVAAPFAGHVLADLGATVLKVEKPEDGDDTRSWGPPFVNGTACTFQALNRNKHSLAIDLKDPAQRKTLRHYIADRVDVVLQNMRPGLIARMELDAATLRAADPRLIYCNMHAFGASGPLAGRPGYDPLMQAFGGIMSVTGEPGRPPVRVGPSMVDVGTGMWTVIGILSALHRRAATGEGCEIDTSLFETSLSWMQSHIASFMATGKVPGKRGTEHPTLVPYKVFKAADDYLSIAAGNDNIFRRLAGALGRLDWLDDARFATNPERVRNRETVNEAVAAVVATRPRGEWLALLEAAGVPCAPLQTLDQVMQHPQTRALGMLQRTPDGSVSLMGLPVSFDGVRPPLRKAPPELGADTHLILEHRSETR